jgi:hypothetical protein
MSGKWTLTPFSLPFSLTPFSWTPFSLRLRSLAPFFVIVVVLGMTSCADRPELHPGPTGRVGPAFVVEADLSIDGKPMRLVHVDRCQEFLHSSGFVDVPVGNRYYAAEFGGFSAEEGSRVVAIVAPNMCSIFDERRYGNEKNPEGLILSPRFVPLIAVLPASDDGPLRLYLSKEALTRVGEVVRLDHMTARIPADPATPSNTRPVPFRPMLEGKAQDRCYLGWALSPTDRRTWQSSDDARTFAQASERPRRVPDALMPKLAKDYDFLVKARVAAFHGDLKEYEYIQEAIAVILTEYYVRDGATVLRPKAHVDAREWLHHQINLVSSLLGWGVLPNTSTPQGGPPDTDRSLVQPNRLLPLEWRQGVMAPGITDRPGVVEYWPVSAENCVSYDAYRSGLWRPAPTEECPDQTAICRALVNLDGISLDLRVGDILYWPRHKQFYRLVRSALRFPAIQ